jgi:hypothetical protein
MAVKKSRNMLEIVCLLCSYLSAYKIGLIYWMMPMNTRAHVCVCVCVCGVCVCVCVCVCVLNTDSSTELLTYLTVLSFKLEAKFNISYYISFMPMQNMFETTACVKFAVLCNWN